MTKTAFVGLGIMGGAMAGHQIKAGQDVVVWNRTPSKSEPLVEQGARVAPSLASVVEDRDFVFLCVSRSEDVVECLAQMVPHAKPGTIFIDHSTIASHVAREIHTDLASKGMGFLDAPITGGSMGAQKGQLTIFVGGEDDHFAAAEPVMAPYSKRTAHVGGPGQGQVTKMANQIAVAGALTALCESLAFAQRAGLDIALTRELLSGGSAGSWAFDNYGPKIIATDWSPGFSVTNQQKDLKYCLDAANEMGMKIPSTELIHQLLHVLEVEGRGNDTTAALFDVLVRS